MKIANQRRTDMLTLLKVRGEMSIQELADVFKVSTLTIRRDIAQLEKAGVKRHHGGARFVTAPYASHQIQRQLAIAKAAAKRMNDNDIVFINSSSTALLVLSQIENTYLTAITNNGKALSMSIDPRIHLVLCGGDISFPKEALTGEFAISNLNKVTATRCIIGIGGLSHSMGLSTQNLAEVAINNTMLSRTLGEKIIVADSSKINHNSAFSSGELSAIDTLITDKQADSKFIEILQQMEINVILVDA
ncbi:MAG: ArsR family transcriptional regulator [Proteobacteria bacterium]|nr:MAG: ArsR family transcriptional regulator [Pseudomonadota bacterium]